MMNDFSFQRNIPLLFFHDPDRVIYSDQRGGSGRYGLPQIAYENVCRNRFMPPLRHAHTACARHALRQDVHNGEIIVDKTRQMQKRLVGILGRELRHIDSQRAVALAVVLVGRTAAFMALLEAVRNIETHRFAFAVMVMRQGRSYLYRH